MKQRKSRVLHFLFTLMIFFTLMGCTGGTKDKEADVVARIDNENITIKEFNDSFSAESSRYASLRPMDKKSELKLKSVHLMQMIEEKLIIMQARKKGIIVGNEEIDAAIAGVRENYGDAESFKKVFIKEHLDIQKWREKITKKLMIEKVVSQSVLINAKIPEETIEEYYKANTSDFHVEEQVKVRQIFTKDANKAHDARERVRGGEDFEKVAREVSESPDAAEGGSLGFFGREVMPPEFDEVVFTLEPGTLSDVVRSTYGHHVFLVEERKEERDMSYEEVKGKIEEVLKRSMEEDLYEKWINDLKNNSKIEINQELMQRSAN